MRLLISVFALFILVSSPAPADTITHPLTNLISRACALALGQMAQSLQGHYVSLVPIKIGLLYGNNPVYPMIPVEHVLADFDPSSEIIFGFANLCHGYVAGAGYRFDGNGFGAGWTRRNGILISPGAFVRLSGLRDYQMESLRTVFEFHVKFDNGISCIDQTLNPLQAAGIQLNASDPPVLPVDIFLAAFLGTFTHHDGIPVKSRAYVTEGATLEDLLHWAVKRHMEREKQITQKIMEAGGKIPPFFLDALEHLRPQVKARLMGIYQERFSTSAQTHSH